MNIPDLSEVAISLIRKYNNQSPSHTLGTLDLNPKLQEEELVDFLQDAIRNNKPISDQNKYIYVDVSDLPEDALR